MRKALGLLALVVGVAVLAAPDLAPLDAQDKKKVKEDPKAKAKGKKEAAGTVEIYKAKDGYRFRVKDADGKTLAIPPRAQADKDDVVKTLEDLKAILNKATPAEGKD